MIADGKLDSEIRVQAGLDHLLQNHSGASAGSVDTKSLEEACGVGIVVTPEMIEQEVLKISKISLQACHFDTFVKTQGEKKPAKLKNLKNSKFQEFFFKFE